MSDRVSDQDRRDSKAILITAWWGLFLLFLVASVTLFLFGYALLRTDSLPETVTTCLNCISSLSSGAAFTCVEECKLGPAPDWPVWARCTLIFIVLVAVAGPLYLLFRAYQDESDRERKGALVKNKLVVLIVVHFLPYTVLAMAMLFEYHYVKEGGPHGAAAIGAVMILYILSELGVALLHVVFSVQESAEELLKKTQSATKRFRRTSRKMENVVQKSGEQISTVRILKHYVALITPYIHDVTRGDAGDQAKSPTVQTSFEDLLGSWTSFVTGRSDVTQAKLLRRLLSEYFSEEKTDIAGELPRTRVPVEVWPDTTRDDLSGRVAFFATNVGYYARFLETAVRDLRSSLAEERVDGRRPCLATVTNVPPSRWWNWLDETTAEGNHQYNLYDPIVLYREALAGIVLQGDLRARVFRTVLVGDGQGCGCLYSSEAWKAEESLLFQLDEKGAPTRVEPKVLWSSKLDLDKAPYEYVLPNPERPYYPMLQGTDGATFDRNQEGRIVLRSRTGSAVSIEGPLASCRLVREVYAETMHPGKDCGFTEILLCNTKDLDGFAQFDKRPDLTLLGWCNASDVWEAKEGEYGWHLATLATMNPKTETMFLTVVFDASTIESLWERTKAARKTVKGKGGRVLGKTDGGQWSKG